MKRTCLVVAYVVFIALTQPSLAQQRVLLTKALSEVRQVYGTRFAYEEHLLDSVYVSGSLKLSRDEPVENVLKNLLYSKGFLFLYIQKNYYAIIKDHRKAPAADAVDSTTGVRKVTNAELYIQTVNGRVTDINGLPLIGASVLPEGYAVSQGVTTNSDGYYTLRLHVRTSAIVFSYIGMQPKRLTLDGKSTLNAQLEYEGGQLTEVNVVATGYQTLPKERITGSAVVIDKKAIRQVPSNNLLDRIQGLAPGVRVDPRTNTISIRGINTLSTNAGSTPLIVIDGFPAIDQSLTERLNSVSASGAILSRYNPEDIESITILKDAAATSIWGAKAANGVIVITTKKGQKNSSSINFGTNVSISNPANIKNLNRMNGAQYVDLEKEMFKLGYYTDPAQWSPSWMPFNYNAPVSPALEWMFKVQRGTATAAERDSALDALGRLDNRQQIRDLLLQRAVSQQYNLSLSGGGQNNTYYISTNYSKDIPAFRSNKAEAFFLTANLSNNLFNNRVTLNTGINYNYTTSVSNQAAINAIGNTNLGLRPYDMLADQAGNPIARNLVFQDDVATNFVSQGYLPWSYSPVQELGYSNNINKTNRFRFIASINTKINSWINIDVAGSLQKTIGQADNLDEVNSYNTRILLNTGTTVLPGGTLSYGVPYGAKLITNTTNGNNYSLRGQLNINKNWGIYSLNALAGTEIREDKQNSFQQTRYGYDPDTKSSAAYNPNVYYNTVYGWTQNLGYSDGTINSGINRFLSYYSNAALGILQNRYTLSGSVRFDDLTLLGVSRRNRAKPLWSAGVKWNVLDERFMRHMDWISTLNLRATYGTGGTVPLSATNAAIISFQGINNITGQPYGVIISPANSTSSWELTKTWNWGLDLGLFHNRLQLSADVYRKKTSDILWTFPINGTYGWTSLQYNAASMKGHGIDLGITGQIINGRTFTWSSTINFGYNTNTVTDSRFTKPTSVTLVASSTPVVGLPTDYLYAYRWAGLDNKGRSQILDKTGKIVNADVYNTSLTVDDLVYKGRTTPPYFGGFFNTFSYKSFSLNIRINYEMGHVFRRMSVQNYPDYQTTNYNGVLGTQQDLALRWRKPGDEANTNVPGIPNVNFNSIDRYKNSDLLVLSGSNIRLQQVSLNYQLPMSVLKTLPIKSASFSIAARNLGIIWRKNKEGVDPSYITTNNYNNLPPSTAWFITFNAGF
ncbi:MAG: SusC/RagA family TonB-linked outer membrane protein [Chitinophagaceae bacterium]|nr:SusC/RagA family TonB-linked outer membrane protein [Chitinophagaceae bacterium]